MAAYFFDTSGLVKRYIKETGTSKDWCKFIELLNATNYWQMPVKEKEIGENDGSR